MCDFDLDAIIFGAPEHIQPLAEFIENFDPNSIQELQLENETQGVDTCCSLLSYSTPEPVPQVGEYQLEFPPTPVPWISELLAPVPAASADPVPSNSASVTPVSEPRLASACQEEWPSKRQRNNIAVKKCREKAKTEHRRNAEKLSKIPAIVERMRCLLKKINADADNIIVLNELNEYCDQLLWTFAHYELCIFFSI